MTTGIQCQADPRCEVPAPSETGICCCHAKQARKGDITWLNLSEKARRASSREPEREPEP
jgi:hypothetical protein